MKRANGWGSVSLISKDAKKKRRNPYVARVSVWDDKHIKRQRITIGTFPTSAAAFEALKKYEGLSVAPSSTSTPILKDLLLEALESLDSIRSESTLSSYRTSIKKLERFHPVPVDVLSWNMIQDYFDEEINSGVSYAILIKQKTILSEALMLAMRRGFVSSNVAELIDLRRASRDVRLERSIFTHDEIMRLWQDWRFCDVSRVALVMLYSGARVSGAFALDKEHVDLQKRTLYIEETKTAAGRRIVPICDKLFPLLEEYYSNHETLYPGSYGTLKNVFLKIMKSKGFEHRAHDCRHTAITHLNSAVLPSGSRIDLNVIKVLTGHRVSDITRGLYNHELWPNLVEAMQTLNDL